MISTCEVNKKAYSQIAKAYHENTKNLSMKWQQEIFSQMLGNQGSILDLMCGTGRDAKYFSQQGFDVTGVDNVKEMVSIAKQYAPKAEFITQDVLELKLAKEFDGVWCNAGIFMLPKFKNEEFLEIAHQHLKPQGILYLSFKVGKYEYFFQDKRYEVKRFEAHYQPEEIKELTKELFSFELEMNTNENNDYRQKPMIDMFFRKK
ncbi:MAG: class I SAM-dependent methyltransferase [Candidatus Nanoarchaeia archaeon]